jgi:nitrous oxide reductase accessory protein NosL
MIGKPKKRFRVVLTDNVVIEYDDREDAKDAGKRTGGKVQGFDPMRGWIPEKYVVDAESRKKKK